MHSELLKIAKVEKVILILRRQDLFAISLWKQLILSEDRFAKLIHPSILFLMNDQSADLSTAPICLDWSLYYEQLRAYFEDASILVLPYEMFYSSPLIFIGKITSFLGLPSDYIPKVKTEITNKSVESTGYKSHYVDIINHGYSSPLALRKASRFLSRRISWLPNFLTYDSLVTPFPEIQLQDFYSRFRLSNQQISSKIGIDLVSYGY